MGTAVQQKEENLVIIFNVFFIKNFLHCSIVGRKYLLEDTE